MKQTIDTDHNGDRRWEDNCGNLRDMEQPIQDHKIEAFIESEEGIEYIMDILNDSKLLGVYIQSFASGDDFPAGEIKKWVWQIAKDKLERDQ